MTRIRSRHLAMIIAVAMFFAGGFVFGVQDADAASKPKAPKKISSSQGDNYAKISWSKVAKNVKGYTIYRDGNAIKTVASSVTKYKDTGLNPETNYSYKVRAYNTVKKKHWYNKKTGKWQIKKPAKKYRGKSKKMKVKVYGSYSATITIKTTGVLKMTNGGYTFTASEVKAEGGLIERDVLASQCPNCGVYGEKVSFIYDGKNLSSHISGTDYSKKCHHCDGVTVTGRCGDRWFTTEGELDLETHKLKNKETLRDHKNYENVVEGSEPSDCKKTITVAGSETDPDSYKKYVYCFKCGKLEVKPTDVPSGWSFDPRQ